ncbi:MAG: serine--tRNA ligase [Gammaproteobacteria bacterium RIFCSPHIGHO2_12_FULL_37_34]|nr:MAG: serine--tRNA ligase [Gammaproteobacteria bacterium RIFCSPHIGHO2_12_FULL_37_34]
MLDPKLIRTSIASVAAQLTKRGLVLDVEKFNALEEQRKQLQMTIQALQNQRNIQSKEVGRAKATGNHTEDVLKQLKELSDTLKLKETQFATIQTDLDNFLACIPNLPQESVPVGKSEEDNRVERTSLQPTSFSFVAKDHVELGAKNNWMDFETAAKLSGARFVVLRGPLARLQRALIQFMMDIHTREHGYQEIAVPYIVHGDCLFGTGQLPKFKEDLFAINSEDEKYLISTSEVPVTNTIRDSIIDSKQLPIKYVCYSSCFRSEAGSYGKDIRGMLRQHQFEKVELLQMVTPEQSDQALEELTYHAEVILQRLELPYRVVTLCTADLGFAAAKTYDLEVWLPGQKRYREISSCSNTESFQARRMKARWRSESGDIDFVHTLNGSGVAVGRALIAILENHQDELGRIHIPRALQTYMDGMKVIE